MSKNIIVHLGGIDVTSYLRIAEITSTYGEAITTYFFEFTINVNDAVAISNALTVEVWLDSSVPPTTKIFDGFIDLFRPEKGMIEIVAKDQLAILINKQVMHYYNSSVNGDASFPDGKLSNIFADLVVTHGGLSCISSGIGLTVQDSGTEIVQLEFPCRNADIFERCRKIADTLDWVFYYKASDGEVYFEPKNYTTNANTLTVGTEIVELPTWEYDRSEMINDLRLEGAQQLVTGTQMFTGDGTTTVFTLSNIPVATAVYYASGKNYSTTAKLASEIQPGAITGGGTGAYEIDPSTKKITFITFTPANDVANNILAEVSYYAPIPIHLDNPPSKAIYGVYAKTITLTDVINLPDAWNRANNIIEKYRVPFVSAKLKVKWENDLDLVLGQAIHIVDSINEPNIDQNFTIYKITDLYPQSLVELEVGDKQFTIEEYQANIIERVKRLEEGLIGTTDDFSELVQTEIDFAVTLSSTNVLIQSINDSFVLGHPDNSILGTSLLGNRVSTLSSMTYIWADI